MENEELNQAQEAPALDTKAFDRINARLDAIEAKAQRPGVAVTGPTVTAEQKAFGNYLRRGTIWTTWTARP